MLSFFGCFFFFFLEIGGNLYSAGAFFVVNLWGELPGESCRLAPHGTLEHCSQPQDGQERGVPGVPGQGRQWVMVGTWGEK